MPTKFRYRFLTLMGWLGSSITLLDQAAGGSFELVASDKPAAILTDPDDFKVVSDLGGLNPSHLGPPEYPSTNC